MQDLDSINILDVYCDLVCQYVGKKSTGELSEADDYAMRVELNRLDELIDKKFPGLRTGPKDNVTWLEKQGEVI